MQNIINTLLEKLATNEMGFTRVEDLQVTVRTLHADADWKRTLFDLGNIHTYEVLYDTMLQPMEFEMLIYPSTCPRLCGILDKMLIAGGRTVKNKFQLTLLARRCFPDLAAEYDKSFGHDEPDGNTLCRIADAMDDKDSALLYGSFAA